MRKYPSLIGAGAMVLGTALAATPASAAVSESETTYVQDCVDQVRSLQASGEAAGLAVDDCLVEATTTAGEPYIVSVEEARAADLPAEEKDRLVAAAAAQAVTGRHWRPFSRMGTSPALGQRPAEA